MTGQLEAAASAVEAAARITASASERLARESADDGRISVAKLESMLARAFVADAVAELVARLVGRDEEWAADPVDLAPSHDFVSEHRSPEFLEELAGQLPRHGTGPTHLS